MHTVRIAKVALLTATLTAGICCGAGDVPSAPGGDSGSSGQAAAVYVDSAAAQREFAGGDMDVYYVSFSLREATGRTGATIKAMDLTFGNGVTATFGPERAAAARVGPGQVVSVADLSATGSVNSRATGVQIRILLTDDRGQHSISLAATSIMRWSRRCARVSRRFRTA